MTLAEAKLVIQSGLEFGEAYQMIDEHDREALKDWYVRADGVPKNPTKPEKTPTAALETRSPAVARGTQSRPNGSSNAKPGPQRVGHASPTGNPCPACGGLNLVRRGSCVQCLDCQHDEGCG